MPILPVLDILHGQVVRGVAGRRHEYRPIISRWTRSVQPCAIARALHDRYGFRDLYIADLDAITGGPPSWAAYEALLGDGFRLWVDAGVRHPADIDALLAAGVATAVAGLETVASPHTLHDACTCHGPQPIVFSLDLHNGRPLGSIEAWGTDDVAAIVQRACAAGVMRLLVLDLAHVGVGTGTPTRELCARLRSLHPDREIATGGGVRGAGDVRDLYAAGVDYVLVASALHDGRITPADVTALATS